MASLQKHSNHLVLASTSKARERILKQVGVIPNCTFATDINEEVLKKEKVHNYVTRLALQKAQVAKQNFTNSYIIAGDTVVYFQHKIIGKPKNKEDAKLILSSLMGRAHKVFTGFCVICPNNKVVNKYCVSRVKFGSFTNFEIENYLENQDFLNKAGAYGIQGKGALFVSSIIGSYSNVIGLPVNSVYNALKGLGYKSYLNSK